MSKYFCIFVRCFMRGCEMCAQNKNNRRSCKRKNKRYDEANFYYFDGCGSEHGNDDG